MKNISCLISMLAIFFISQSSYANIVNECVQIQINTATLWDVHAKYLVCVHGKPFGYFERNIPAASTVHIDVVNGSEMTFIKKGGVFDVNQTIIATRAKPAVSCAGLGNLNWMTTATVARCYPTTR